VTFRNKFIFYSEESIAPRLSPKLEDHLFSALRDCLFNIFRATVHIGGPSLPFATWGRAMPWWQGTHLTRGNGLSGSIKGMTFSTRWVTISFTYFRLNRSYYEIFRQNLSILLTHCLRSVDILNWTRDSRTCVLFKITFWKYPWTSAHSFWITLSIDSSITFD
jgi:hypothetical protein